MSDGGAQKIAVGDEVRIHFHPPGPWKSFCEGEVRRVDVTTPAGRFFVVEIGHEVIFDREHRIRRGFPDYVKYEGRTDFPGRIEVLSATEQSKIDHPEPSSATGLRPVEVRDDLAQEPEAEHGQLLVQLERQGVRRHGGLLAALFGRQK